MKTPKKDAPKPARERAHEFLIGRIEAANRSGVARLPAIAELAASAGVAPVTMLRAVRAMRDAGVLAVSHGKGIRVVAQMLPDEKNSSPGQQARWREVVHLLEQDILEGRHDNDGVLPSPKQMRHRFGVSHRTLRRALDHLTGLGVIRPYRRSHQVVSPMQVHGGRHRILLVTSEGMTRHAQFQDARSQALFLALEQQCSRHELRLEIASHSDIRGAALGKGNHRSSVLGTVVWGLALGPDTLNTVLPDLPDAPIAVLLHVADRRYREIVRPVRRARTFSFANSHMPGRIVGTYLRKQGHRRIAYLAPIYRDSWTKNRLAGLKETFNGRDRQVFAVTRDHLSADDEPGGVRGAYDATIRQLRTAADRGEVSPTLPILVTAIEQMSDTVYAAFGHQYLYASLDPIFEEALALPGVTAWVTHNDDVGLKALEFLRSKGIQVPQQMSVVGFDNIPQASRVSLSSYDYDFGSLTHMVVDYLTSSALWRRAKEGDCDCGVRGTVVERLSSAGTPGPGVGLEA